MVVKIKSDDATFIANKKNETFLVEADTNLVFLTDLGILGQDQAGGRTIRIDGSVNAAKATGGGGSAINLNCSARKTEHVVVGSSGDVTATFNAIVVSGGLVDIRISGKLEGGFRALTVSTDAATIRNSGVIEGGASSALAFSTGVATLKNSGQILSNDSNAIVLFGDSSVISNSGTIEAGAGVPAIDLLHGELDLTNKGSLISENGPAVALGANGVASGVGNATIDNAGTIAGKDVAIEGKSAPSNDAFTIINTGDMIGDIDLSGSARNDLVDTSNGRVEGDVLTGAGNDRIVMVDAVVTGEVSGGEDDDTYTISSNAISLAEDVGGGTDTIRVTGNVSIILADNFENVVLIGANDTQATGNSADNRMTGNSGNNFIEGANGEDTIRGGKGRDELIGGGDADTFIFRKGDGKDLIGDFDTGGSHDFLDLSDIKGITDFDDLIDNHAKDVDSDVVINAGKGDQIVLEGLSVADLRSEMFFL